MGKEQSRGKKNKGKKGKKSAEKESTEGPSAPSFICPTPTERGSDQFDVFLSFEGSDTRKKFTDHLYHSLVKAGIVPISVFKDDKSIPIGEEFASQIFGAIMRSKISIPIISENYATSKWCLRELVHMMDSRKSTSHRVLPIFYELKPSDVRRLQGKFGKAYHSRKECFDKDDIPKFEQALIDVSRLQVWESEKIVSGREGELVEVVVKTVQSMLRHDFQPDVTENLVGIDDHVKNIMTWVDSPATHARMIEIYGMGGIGKTTLAKVIYNELSEIFLDRSCVLNIRDKANRQGIPYVQNQLIRHILPTEREVSEVDDGINLIKSRFKFKKVLLLLDDIDEGEQGGKQLHALARKRDWFKEGSIIIVTTRNKAVLDQSKFGEVYEYELNEMDEVHSLLLFNKHAFCLDHSPSDFESRSRDIVSSMGGLPLALQVVGSYLYKKTKVKVWEDVQKKLKNQPHRDVQKTLQISYDGLEDGHKQIFLDIACFVIDEDINYAMYMWEDCDFYPNEGIEELKLRCLIKIGDDDKFTMHDQLRDLAKIIFCQGQLPERCIRLWVDKEAFKLQSKIRDRKMYNAIAYYGDYDKASWDYWPGPLETYTNEQFENLPSSRFLQLSRAALSGDFKELFSQLRWLRWFYTEPNLSFSAINLHLPELVVLELSHNKFEDNWGGWSSITAAKRLKVLDLAYSKYLRCSPDLWAFTELEILILNHCCQLEQVHPSIGNIKSLVSLDLSWCVSLKDLPEEVGKLKELKKLILHGVGITKIPMSIGSLGKLEKLDASSCQSLREIPSAIGNLSSLKHLNLQGCESLIGIPSSIGSLSSLQHLNLEGCKSLGEIPNSIGNLSSLQHLNLRRCESLSRIPSSMGNLSSLQHLDLQDCQSLTEIPSSIGDLHNLQHLNISRSGIEKLPNDIGRLKELRRLVLESCGSLKGEIPSEIGDLSSLENLQITWTTLSDLPESIQNLSSLERLDLKGCFKLRSLPELPSSLTCLTVSCQSPRLPQLSCLTHLEELNLYSCALLDEYISELPSRLLKLDVQYCDKLLLLKLDGLKYLEKFSIEYCSSIERLELSQLNHLKGLDASYCHHLAEILGQDNLEFLEEISIWGCESLRRLILSDLRCLKQLTIHSCNNLVEIRGLDKAELLEKLVIYKCESIEKLPDLSCYTTLRRLNIDGCDNLCGVESLERFLSCRSICIVECKSLENLPNLSKFENLENFTITCSLRLTEIPGIEESRSLAHIDIGGCESMETLPDLSGCEKLKSLVVRDCKKLTQLQGLEKLALNYLDISGCDSLEKIPEIPATRIFRNYERPYYEDWNQDWNRDIVLQ